MDSAAIICFGFKTVVSWYKSSLQKKEIRTTVLNVKPTLAKLRREWRCSKQHHLPNIKRRKVYPWILEKVTVWRCFVSHVPCLLWWEWSDSAALSNRTTSASDTRPLKSSAAHHSEHSFLCIIQVLLRFCFNSYYWNQFTREENSK